MLATTVPWVDPKRLCSAYSGVGLKDYSGDERLYSVAAQDSFGFTSLERSLLLPMLTMEFVPETRLLRGVMNRPSVRVENFGESRIENIQLKVDVAGRSHLSQVFALAGKSSQLVPITIGGYSDLPASGEQAKMVRKDTVAVGNSMLVLQLGNEEFALILADTSYYG